MTITSAWTRASNKHILRSVKQYVEYLETFDFYLEHLRNFAKEYCSEHNKYFLNF